MESFRREKMKYLDTVTEDVDRIEEARKNIWKGILFLFAGFCILGFISLFFYLIEYKLTAILMMIISGMYLTLMIGLMVKREIYSLTILIKEKK